MIKFKVNSSPIDFKSIWYHAQAVPKPGGNVYCIEITRDEESLFKIMENMLGVKTTDDTFSSLGISSGNDSSYNLVRYILEYLDKTNTGTSKEYNIEWVFNNISKLEVDKEKMIIEGAASKAIGNF